MRAQVLSPLYTHIYAALMAVVNTKVIFNLFILKIVSKKRGITTKEIGNSITSCI